MTFPAPPQSKKGCSVMRLLARFWAVCDRLEDGWLVPACSVALLFGSLFVMLSIGGQP